LREGNPNGSFPLQQHWPARNAAASMNGGFEDAAPQRANEIDRQ